MYLHEDIPAAIIMNSEEDKGFVSSVPFQNSEFNDGTLKDLKRIDVVENLGG